MAPPTASYDDPSSFLFGLNHFGSPGMADGAGQQGHQGQQEGSGSGHGSQSLLAGIEAFGGAGNGSGSENGNGLLEGGSFADELALWTNANFSFDGPTGHALLGDEEKDKDKDKDEDKDTEDQRAGKRSRNNNDGERDAAGRPLPRNGKNRLHDKESQDDGTGRPTGLPSQSSGSGLNGQPHAQPSHAGFPYSAPFAGQGTGPGLNGFGAPPMHQQQRQSQAASGSQTPSVQPHGNQAQGNTGMDLTSLMAIQQLIATNPLALATLGSFTGLNPQLGQLGAANPQMLQQLQQQVQQQQAQRMQSPFLQQSQPAMTLGGQQPSPYAPNTSMPFPYPPMQQNAPGMNNAPQPPPFSLNPAALPYHGMISQPINGSPQQNGQPSPAPFSGRVSTQPSQPAPANEATNSRGRTSSGDDNSDSKSKGKFAAEQEDIEREDQIPPLKLIDTGNPVADAEANRLAIEEDKRRRNTAASARFRVKKKQRDAALEARNKELEDQVSELKDDIEKLRNENQWLKGLIQVRAGPDPSGQDNKSGFVDAGPAHLPTYAPQPQPSLDEQDFGSASGNSSLGHLGHSEERHRHTGLNPRGVGTAADSPASVKTSSDEAATGAKRDRGA